ncbi:MAG: hypothetical protein NTX25_17130 [Proteobacteria bacterium]|nr:hypothetical protein [Pseudomonadota bacterium]
MVENPSAKRRFIRFEPDSGDYVQIDKDPEGASFTCHEVALLVEESPMGGCSIACLKSIRLSKGSIYRFKVGKMSPLKAEVVWIRELDDKLERCGLRFLE